jgi:ribosomal protein L32
MSNDKPVRPWDMFNKNMERVMPVIQEKRMSVCKSCPQFIRFTHQCKKCGCLMDAKTKLADATCPIGKWGKANVHIPLTTEITEEDLKKIREE